ncbi:flagellar filament capping protein FliD [Thiomicrorhabdus sp. Milos-T2]|uniref:flagellar filament capping protein FliD n=1 Tax=Thiomicrorhabdus sp. Milos-T2 TaxID=90814 RepID=UPI000494D8CF|nr:flagellar filament capping protein FliD [Thiomicrorhabdus sp. Milos-T2]
MANEIGTTLVNSLTNSTFDIGAMSKSLAEAEVAGPRAILERNQEKTNTELNAFNYLKLNLDAFNSYVADLSNPETFLKKTATSSDESVVSVTASSDVVPGSYQIESKQLAQYHTQVVNKSYASPYDSISSGTLQIQTGSETHQITVDSSNNTLESLQKYINNGDYGVNASVINNGGSYQLMFTSKQQGAAGEVSISGLTDFDVDGLTTTSEAQDAIMVVNGLAVSNSTNTFDEVIDGLSFKLNSAAANQSNTVSISNDTDGAVESINSFVDVYNQLDTIFDELSSYDTSDLTEEQLQSDEYKFYGDLAGNSTLKQARSNLNDALTGAISEISGNYNSLISVGIKKNLDGQLELDDSVLDKVVNNNFSALSSLFAKGGSSDDGLINVISGSTDTLTGSYQLDVTQLAERAVVTTGAANPSSDEQVASDRIIDTASALQISSGASLDISIGGAQQIIDLSSLAGSYADKDTVASTLQGAINGAFGSSLATVSYDVAQARFEIAANSGSGSVVINSSSGLANQGFTSAKQYNGEALIDLTSGTLSFDVAVDDSSVATIDMVAGKYTHSELALSMANAINNNSVIQESGNSVSVSSDGSALSIASKRFGGFSNIDISSVSAGFLNSGLAVDSDAGQSVDGTLTTESGTINIGAYADSTDGRVIKISDYAIIGGEDAEVRGLQFEVLGGEYDGGGALITNRGDLNFAKGFGAKLEEAINGLFDEDTGVVARKVSSLTDKLDVYTEKTTDLDARYAKLEAKYQLQFSMLQTILSNAESTRNSLIAQFNNSSN